MAGQRYGFKGYLDVLGEGGSRHVELIGGRAASPELRLLPAVAPARGKIPLTQLEISRLFDPRPKSRVSIEH